MAVYRNASTLQAVGVRITRAPSSRVVLAKNVATNEFAAVKVIDINRLKGNDVVIRKEINPFVSLLAVALYRLCIDRSAQVFSGMRTSFDSTATNSSIPTTISFLSTQPAVNCLT